MNIKIGRSVLNFVAPKGLPYYILDKNGFV